MTEIIKFEDFRSRNAPISMDLFEQNVYYIESEMRRMRRQGLSKEQINENIFSDIITGLGGGFTDILKNYVVDWAAQKMGVETHDESGQPSFFYQVIRNVIEKMEWKKIGSYFGKGSCSHWAKALVLGIADSIEEKVVTTILSSLGIQVDERGGLANTLALSIRQGLQNAINDMDFMKKIEGMISGKICGADFSDVLSNIKRSDEDKITDQIEKASEDDPNILKKVASTGIMDVLSKTVSP